MSSKIERLGERLDELTHNSQGPALTTEEANMVRYFWIQLNFSPDEAKEYDILNKRHEVLYEAYLAGKFDSEMQKEWTKGGKRMVEIAHDTVMNRVIDNHALRDRVWPELAPRVLRYWKLVDKPREQLTSAESEELKGLLEWFDKLRVEALEAAERELTKTSGLDPTTGAPFD